MNFVRTCMATAIIAALLGCASGDPRPSAERNPPPAAPTRAQDERGPAALSFPYLRADDAPRGEFRAIAERAKNSYVRVRIMARGNPLRGEPGGEIHTGSGIVVDTQGHIVTAAHIARGREFYAEITTMDGQTRPARVLLVAPKQELALLLAEGLQNPSPAVFADSNKLRKGDFALGIGSPNAQRGVATLGDVRLVAPTEEIEHGEWASQGYVELNMKIDIGHSGGPVFDRDARVVGLLFGYELGDEKTADPRIAYAVPSNNIVAFLKNALPK